MKKIITLLCILSLVGCSTISDKAISVGTSKNTFAACRATDVVTTEYIIHKGGVELNPVMKPLVAHPALFALFNVALVWFVWKEFDKMTNTEKVAVNAVGCVGGIHNTFELVK
jgi:hypothetical protein